MHDFVAREGLFGDLSDLLDSKRIYGRIFQIKERETGDVIVDDDPLWTIVKAVEQECDVLLPLLSEEVAGFVWRFICLIYLTEPLVYLHFPETSSKLHDEPSSRVRYMSGLVEGSVGFL